MTSNRLEKTTVILLFTGAAVFLGHLLFSAVSAFSAQNYLMSDYGVYTNTIYNLAHGNGFKFLAGHSYLKTHLSFSLVLLAPIFWFTRSPLVLLVVQWLFLASGCTILLRIMRRLQQPLIMRAAICFFACAYPMTQSVMLSEFHGVSAYYVLLPWLLHTLLFHRSLTAIPLIVILGLREDAGIAVLPMILYIAVTEKWKTGYVYAGISLLYVILAVTAIYPAINGTSLFEVRAPEASAESLAAAWSAESAASRGTAILWVALPAVPFLLLCGRKVLPIFVFPLTALLTAMLSGFPRQHSLAFHYPAPIMAAMLCGMALAVHGTGPALSSRRYTITVWVLAATVLVSHFLNGFFMGSRSANPVYAGISPKIWPLLRLARAVPRDGLLVADKKLAPYFAAREDVTTWQWFDDESQKPYLIVCALGGAYHGGSRKLEQTLRAEKFRIIQQSLPYIVLAPTEDEQHHDLDHPLISPVIMRTQGGDVVCDDEHGLVKYWHGLAREAPITLAYGIPFHLEAGLFEAVFVLRTQSGNGSPEKGFGVLSVHHMNIDPAIASAEIQPSGDYGEQRLSFELESPAKIEPRITGGGAELWIREIRIIRRATP